MTRLSEQEALSLLIEAIEEDHAVYASSVEAVARWKRLRAFAFNAVAAEERGRRSGVEEERKRCTCGHAPGCAMFLAPRDSAPDTHGTATGICPRCGFRLDDPDFGKCPGKPASRDSGKEGQR